MLSLLTTFCTSTPWSWKMILFSFSRVPNTCKPLCEAKDFHHASTAPHLNNASGPFVSQELVLATFSSYQEGFACRFSPQSLPLGLCVWQMLVSLLQACKIQLWPVMDGGITWGLSPFPLFTYVKIHVGNNFAPVLDGSHSQDTRAMIVISQKTFQADDLEDISLTSLSGPVLNMGCNISCSLGLGPGMSSHSSKWWQIHPVSWDAALPALHYSSAKKRTTYFLCGFFWFPSCSSWILSCLWLLHQRLILYQSFLLHQSSDHLLTC